MMWAIPHKLFWLDKMIELFQVPPRDFISFGFTMLIQIWKANGVLGTFDILCCHFRSHYFNLIKLISNSEIQVDWFDFSSKSAHSFSVKSTSLKTVPVSRPSSSSSSSGTWKHYDLGTEMPRITSLLQRNNIFAIFRYVYPFHTTIKGMHRILIGQLGKSKVWWNFLSQYVIERQ